RSLCEVDVRYGDLAFRESASRVESDPKRSPEPGRLGERGFQERVDLGISQFSLVPRRRHSPDPQARDGVGGAIAAPHGFVDEVGKELQLKQRGIVADLLSVHGALLSPGEIERGVLVTDMPRENNLLFREKQPDGLPCDHESSPVALGSRGAVGFDERWDPPGQSGLAAGGRGNRGFIGGGFCGEVSGFSRVVRRVAAQSRGPFRPFSCVWVFRSDVPEGRACVSSDRGHATVSHGVTRPAWFNLFFRCFPWAAVGCYRLFRATVTPPGIEFLSCLRSGLTRVSHKTALKRAERSVRSPDTLAPQKTDTIATYRERRPFP